MEPVRETVVIVVTSAATATPMIAANRILITEFLLVRQGSGAWGPT